MSESWLCSVSGFCNNTNGDLHWVSYCCPAESQHKEEEPPQTYSCWALAFPSCFNAYNKSQCLQMFSNMSNHKAHAKMRCYNLWSTDFKGLSLAFLSCFHNGNYASLKPYILVWVNPFVIMCSCLACVTWKQGHGNGLAQRDFLAKSCVHPSAILMQVQPQIQVQPRLLSGQAFTMEG